MLGLKYFDSRSNVPSASSASETKVMVLLIKFFRHVLKFKDSSWIS